MKYTSFLLIFFFSISTLFAQNSTSQEELLVKSSRIMRLITSNPDEEFRKAITLENKAIEIGAKESELLALVSQCMYYKLQIDFKNLLLTADKLYQKAEVYRMSKYKAIGKYYLFESYLFNRLPEKAFAHLEEGMRYVNQASKEGTTSLSLTNNYYIAFSNYYLQQEDLGNQLKYIKLSGGEISKMPEGTQKHELLYSYYSNLAQVYNEMHQVDSARYYSNLSNSIDKGYNISNIQFMNLITLGQASIKSEEYKVAIKYFKEAEEISGSKNHINVLNLYDNMIIAHQKLHQADSARLYQYKMDSLRLNISENQNKFLHKLVDGIDRTAYYKYLYAIIALLLVIGVFIFIVIRKNRIFAAQEKLSEEYLQKNEVGENAPNMAESHVKLIALVKENNAAFMMYFEEIYPGFTQKLLAINPKISQTDFEFCALLKLKMPTKEIAKVKFIAPKTVQNKKHLIRKKLNISQNIDTYQWFEDL